jgi:excisionase family DNA binding protein
VKERIFSVSEAAAKLGVEPRSVQRWLSKGALRTHYKTAAGARTIRQRDLEAFARKRAKGA